ncbi:hypothetical protein JTB14_007565 [Gonioctena quinquepunctata]|nr:hypothetical protein JTB14_007565 [Gonioctena quinquepunctata]
MWSKVLLLCGFTFMVFFGSSNGEIEEGTPCYTPRQEYGICINIHECEFMVNLLRNSRKNPETVAYLRTSQCGFVGATATPMVCCPQTETNNNVGDGSETRNANISDGGGTDVDEGESNTESRNNQIDNSEDKERETGLRKFLSKPDCGLSNMTNSRVVGGSPAKLGEFPFIVSLGYRNQRNPSVPKWLCGGTLISDRHILTAGHCVHNRKDLYLARLGELDLYSDDDGAHPEDIKLVKAKIHENFNPTQFTNDIAILTLERKPSNPLVWPVCLPHAEPLRSNTYLKYSPVVVGWGALYFNGPSSSTLQVAEIPVVGQENCKRAFGKQTVIDDRIICAGWINGNKDACQGDSGGPLMFGIIEGKSLRFYQIGVVSYGFRCAEAGFPGVYTRGQCSYYFQGTK